MTISETDRANILLELAEAAENNDTEAAHYNADDILCEVLVRLGYADIVEAYDKIDK